MESVVTYNSRLLHKQKYMKSLNDKCVLYGISRKTPRIFSYPQKKFEVNLYDLLGSVQTERENGGMAISMRVLYFLSIFVLL